ncbi:hypothetical protein L208DRAFT_1036013, partial [Tricholoma matsutake]
FDCHQGVVNWEQTIKIEHYSHPESWRLLRLDSQGEFLNEAMFTIQGMLISMELPPLTEVPRTPTWKYKYLRQSVTIRGLSTELFNHAANVSLEIHRLFDRAFAKGIVDNWKVGNVDGAVINMSNYYLTPAKDVPGLQSMPFMAGVDIHGVLEEMLSNKGEKAYTHTEDNQVFYYKSFKDADGSQRPQIFCKGDIIEVQVSFVAVPIRPGSPTKLRRKMFIVLQSLTLLD